MIFGKVGLKWYIIPITFAIFKPMWSVCLLHLVFACLFFSFFLYGMRKYKCCLTDTQ